MAEENQIQKQLNTLTIQQKEDDLQYQKKTQREQILLRPGMYIGSTKNTIAQNPVFIFDDSTTPRIVLRQAEVNDGLLRLFIEVISNALDNVIRSIEFKTTPPKFIRVDIQPDCVSVWNDGRNIPTSMHSTENIPIPELIFGNLLTSSNYDDSKSRKTTGLNGVGVKCLGVEVKVPLWNTEIKTAKDIKVGDQLIGDDGTLRTVQKVLFGNGKMYQIDQSLGESYTVNDHHILTLHMPDHKVIFWNDSHKAWRVLWWNKSEMKIESKEIKAVPLGIVCDECNETLSSSLKRHMKRRHPEVPYVKKPRQSPIVDPLNHKQDKSTDESSEQLEQIVESTEQINQEDYNVVYKTKILQTRQELEKFCETIPDSDGIFDISIQDYMKLDKTTKGRLAGLRAQCLQYPKQEVELDPYVLGLWLGDGFHTGYGFAVNDNLDTETLDYLEKWGQQNDGLLTKRSRCNFRFSSIQNPGKKGFHPLKKLLEKYDLIKNKHIPKAYLFNDRETRLSVLAGMIDTDGTVMREGTRVVISQGLNHTQLINDVVFLARSLGFACSLTKKRTSWSWNGEKKEGEAWIANISGIGLEDLPTLLPRKKFNSPKSHNTSKTTGQIKIKEIEYGDYVGIQIDGNQRFAINDFTITHNCTNIFSSKFVLDIYNKDDGVMYHQEWTNNMLNKSKPVIAKKGFPKTTEEGKNGFTKVTYWPDFKYFGKTSFTEDMILMMKKVVYDAAMTASFHGVKVILNNNPVEMKDINTYVNYYFEHLNDEVDDEEEDEADDEQQDESSSEPNTPRTSKKIKKQGQFMTFASDDTKVIIAPSFSNEFCHVAFTNGIYNKNGGVHVDAWAEAIFRPIVQKLNSDVKGKKAQIDIRDVRKHFFMFIFSSLDKPDFEGQMKELLTTPVPQTEIKPTQISRLMKWEFVKKIEESMKLKETLTFLNDTKRKKGQGRIKGLEDANYAGKKDKTCILCVTEGASALTYLKAGVDLGICGIKGRDYVGMMAIRGKFMNVKNASPASISKNEEVKAIIQAMALEYGTDYSKPENFAKLRYKKFVALSDADVGKSLYFYAFLST